MPAKRNGGKRARRVEEEEPQVPAVAVDRGGQSAFDAFESPRDSHVLVGSRVSCVRVRYSHSVCVCSGLPCKFSMFSKQCKCKTLPHMHGNTQVHYMKTIFVC